MYSVVCIFVHIYGTSVILGDRYIEIPFCIVSLAVSLIPYYGLYIFRNFP